jgi:hypothetical protein
MSVQKQQLSELVNLKCIATVVFGSAPLMLNVSTPELCPGLTEGIIIVDGVTVMPAGTV